MSENLIEHFDQKCNCYFLEETIRFLLSERI